MSINKILKMERILMYAIPIFMLIIGLFLLCVSIYLFLVDYKYVVDNNIRFYYLIPTIVGVLLAIFIIIYVSIYFCIF